MVTHNRVNIGSGKCLLPDGTKPLPEPMLTYHQWVSMAMTWDQFHMNYLRYQFIKRVSEIHMWNYSHIPRDQWVNQSGENCSHLQSDPGRYSADLRLTGHMEHHTQVKGYWDRFQDKDYLPRYRDSHYKDKTVVRPFYLYNGNSSTGKTAFLYWDGHVIANISIFQSLDVCSNTNITVYCQISNISHTLVRNKIVDHSDVVGALPVGAAPTTSSFSTQHLASMDWAKTTSRWDNKHFSCGIWSDLY